MRTTITAGLPVEGVPADYEQLVAEHGGMLRRLVRRQLGPRARPEDVEDVYQYILVMIMPDPAADPPRPGIIAQFDPAQVSASSTHPFETLLCRKAVLYCRGKREELARRGGREWLIVDDAEGDGAWVEKFGAAMDDYAILDDGEVMARMLDHLATVPVQPGSRPLGPLLEHLAGTVAEGGTVGPEGVRQQFGLTRRQAGDYLGELRDALGTLRPGREVTFSLGGMTLTPSELLAHIEALRQNNGHHVVAIWRRAGLRLKDAGKTWYLPLADREMREHPESRQAKGRDVKGGRGSPVKYALIRALERMLTQQASTPVPPPPRPDLAAVEAALRKVPGMTGARVAAALAALEEEP